MKGIILAGGRGTRLMPLTKVTNKHLLPLGKEPMIYNPIKQLVGAGITEICVVTSSHHMGAIVTLLGSGKEFGVDFTYKVQEKALGIAHALSLAENFAGNEPIVVILGDNVCTHSIAPFVHNFAAQAHGARILIKEVNDPERYGIAAIDEKKIIEIQEKPNKPATNFAVLGYYMYDHQVFDIIKTLQPSKRGEYEITDVNNIYIEKNLMQYDILKGDWTDAGTMESYNYANNIMFESDNKIK